MLNQCRREFYKLKNQERAQINMSFFKTAPGEYGEGDKFLGIRMPLIRKHASLYKELSLENIEQLIISAWHEERMLGLVILLNKYEKAKRANNSDAIKYFKFYIKMKKHINSWDLVDVTCPRIVGRELLDSPRDILYKWSKSKDLWTRRLSIVSTLTFIKNNDFKDTLKLSEILMGDSHDLMHKAVGWMLREVGKKDRKVLDNFLRRYQNTMPRTMLRYSIEKHSRKQRDLLLQGVF